MRMDFYLTRFAELTVAEVCELFRADTWSGLSREERLDALQELENRAAEELGNQPCEIRTERMNGSTYGYYSNGQITINENLINDGILRFEDVDGTIIEYAPRDINAQMMDTIHHENYHAYQDEVIHDRLEHDDVAESALWKANDANYISSADNGALYRIQAQERSAFKRGESQAKAAFEKMEARYGEDAGYQEYLVSISENSYDRVLSTVEELYGSENIQHALDDYMLASDHENCEESSNAVVDSTSEDSTMENQSAESLADSSINADSSCDGESDAS